MLGYRTLWVLQCGHISAPLRRWPIAAFLLTLPTCLVSAWHTAGAQEISGNEWMKLRKTKVFFLVLSADLPKIFEHVCLPFSKMQWIGTVSKTQTISKMLGLPWLLHARWSDTVKWIILCHCSTLPRCGIITYWSLSLFLTQSPQTLGISWVMGATFMIMRPLLVQLSLWLRWGPSVASGEAGH